MTNEYREKVLDILKKDIAYAKTSQSKELLYQAHGELLMACKLQVITVSEFLDLDAQVVRDGINNRELIKVWNAQYWAHGPEIAAGLDKQEAQILNKYRNSITRKAFVSFCRDIRILLGMHVPASPLDEEVNNHAKD